VKGAQASWKAGHRLESLPHKTACPTGGRRFQVERAVLRATPPVLAADGIGTPVPFGIVSLCRRARPHGKPGGLLHPAGGPLRWSPQSCVPRRQSWRRMALELPYRSGLCRSAAVTARTASLAACSTAGGALRWSAQSCVPRRQSWRRMAFRTTGQPACMLLCRRDRPHGKPGGMLHCGWPLEVEHAVLRATPSSGARSLACHAASHGGGWHWNSRTVRDCVALPARLPAWPAWRLAPRWARLGKRQGGG